MLSADIIIHHPATLPDYGFNVENFTTSSIALFVMKAQNHNPLAFNTIIPTELVLGASVWKNARGICRTLLAHLLPAGTGAGHILVVGESVYLQSSGSNWWYTGVVKRKADMHLGFPQLCHAILCFGIGCLYCVCSPRAHAREVHQ